MPNQYAVSPAKIEQAKTLLAAGTNKSVVAKIVGIDRGTVSRIKSGAMDVESAETTIPELNQSEEITEDTWSISLPRTNICTLKQLVEHCKIDLKVWEVDRFVANQWAVGAKDKNGDLIVTPLFQIKAWLKKKKAMAFALAEMELLKKEALNYSPKFTGFKPRPTSKSGTMVEFAIYDHHFGALIWGKETGGADWDSKIALGAWKDALSSLVEKVRGYKPEKALLVLGNDQQNADNRDGSTTKLTPQAMDSRYQKVYSVSKEASRWAIDKLLAEYGSVHVVMVSGNHDSLSTWHLGDHLQTWYHNCKNVTIDNSIPFRKWFEYGTVMIMFTHGNSGKLLDYDRIMASERPEMWGRCRWREAHTGDKHQRRVIETKGATIRILPSLRPPCAWSAENHHIGSMRAAEALVWSKTEGLIGTASYSILDQEVPAIKFG